MTLMAKMVPVYMGNMYIFTLFTCFYPYIWKIPACNYSCDESSTITLYFTYPPNLSL